MLCLFIILLSSTALKLSDPVSLRDVTEENVSLRAWCVGVGCVMPFTPYSCLSWCDWNVDKQADAEARGAFAGSRWGEKTQVKAATFWIKLYQVPKNAVPANAGTTCEDGAATKRSYNLVKSETFPVGGVASDDKSYANAAELAAAAIFPGGDQETRYSETEMKCKLCYKIATATAVGVDRTKFNDATGLPKELYLKFSQPGGTDKSSKMNLFTGKKCDSGLIFDGDLPPLAGQTTKTVDANGKKLSASPLDCAPISALKSTLVVGDGGTSNDNTAVLVQFGVQFSGSPVGGMTQPRSCKD